MAVDTTEAGAHIRDTIMKSAIKNIFKNLKVLEENGESLCRF
jgi:hypothetical protein